MNDAVAQDVAAVMGAEAIPASGTQWIVLRDGYFVGVINTVPDYQPREAMQT